MFFLLTIFTNHDPRRMPYQMLKPTLACYVQRIFLKIWHGTTLGLVPMFGYCACEFTCRRSPDTQLHVPDDLMTTTHRLRRQGSATTFLFPLDLPFLIASPTPSLSSSGCEATALGHRSVLMPLPFQDTMYCSDPVRFADDPGH